jgi:hypothetical protein
MTALALDFESAKGSSGFRFYPVAIIRRSWAKKKTLRTSEETHSSSHLLAAFGAATACIRAFPHFTYPLTIRGALFTDFSAFATGEFVKFRAEKHEMRGCPTNLGASHHQGEVLWFGMLTADLQTMAHRRRQARLITAQTFGDAALHLIFDLMHRIAPFTILCPDLTGRDILETPVCRFGSGWGPSNLWPKRGERLRPDTSCKVTRGGVSIIAQEERYCD